MTKMSGEPGIDWPMIWIILVILAWIVIGLWLGADGTFVPQCDDIRPRGC